MKERVCQLFDVFQHEFANLSLPCEGRFRLSFQKLLQTRSTFRNNTKKNVWEKSNDAYSLSIRVQTTINYISICFLPHYQRQRKLVFFRARAENGIARHIDVSSVVWTLIDNGNLANQITSLAAIVDSFPRTRLV